MNLSLNRTAVHSAFRQPLTWLFLLSTIGVWIFVWQHACNMDMTNDEAYSFILIKIHRYRGMPGTANTHWLNSILMKLWSIILGDHPLSLRLHSVLAFPFFTYAIYRLGLLIKNIPAQILFYCLLVLNPYVLDFFALARGYGLAITFQAWSFLLFCSAVQQHFSYRLWLRIALLSAFALAANLSYLYMVLGIAAAFSIFTLQKASFRSFFNNRQIRTISLLFVFQICFAIADLLFIRIRGKDLEFGGDTDFLYSLVGSVWKGSLYFSHEGLLDILMYGSFALLCIVWLYHITQAIRNKKITTVLLLCIPVAGIFLLNICFHLFMGTPYLMVRTAVQWLVPGLFIIFYTIGLWMPSVKINLYNMAVGSAFVLLLLFHLTTTADKYLCHEWFHQKKTKQPLYDLYATGAKNPQFSIVFNGPYRNYYQLTEERFRHYLPSILHEKSGAVACDTMLRNELLTADYTIIYLDHTLQCMKDWEIPYTILKTYPGTPLKLVRLGTTSSIEQTQNNIHAQ